MKLKTGMYIAQYSVFVSKLGGSVHVHFDATDLKY